MNARSAIQHIRSGDLDLVDHDCRHLFPERRRQRMCSVCEAQGKNMPRSYTTAKCRIDVCHDHMQAILDERLTERAAARIVREAGGVDYLHSATRVRGPACWPGGKNREARKVRA